MVILQDFAVMLAGDWKSMLVSKDAGYALNIGQSLLGPMLRRDSPTHKATWEEQRNLRGRAHSAPTLIQKHCKLVCETAYGNDENHDQSHHPQPPRSWLYIMNIS
jgi:hypothetical protein